MLFLLIGQLETKLGYEHFSICKLGLGFGLSGGAVLLFQNETAPSALHRQFHA